MQGLKSKALAAVVTALMVTLPVDEGGVQGAFSKPYTDIAGVRTVCYGHTGKDIEERVYSKAECEQILAKDIEKHLNRVSSCLQREVPTSMLIGFTSFDFNTGGFCSSRALREANKGAFRESCNAMAHGPTGKPAWSYVNGTRFVPGLYSRRLREVKVCYNDLS